MNCFKFLGVICIFCIAGMLYAGSVSDGDIVTGTVQESFISPQTEVVAVPLDFDVDAATAELKQARANGNTERVQELSNLLNAWWIQNADHSPTPMTHGSNPDPGPSYLEESHAPSSGPSLLWGTDVRIDPNNGVRDVKIASLSNGDLYAFSVWYDGSQYHTLVRRSLDNGATWSTYWDNAFSSTTTILYPNIITDNDTLILSYILDHPASNEMRTWAITCLPGASYNPIYYGSITGPFTAVDYTDLHICSDAPVYGTNEYLYATWVEKYYETGNDSTKVMTAVSYENDVSAWEIGPLKLDGTNGDNIYLDGTKTAFGSSTDMLWVVAWLHPNMYPTTYDRSIWGWYSDNYGSTWTGPTYITPYNNDLDEFDPAIAGSHTNTNWVVLATQVETLFVNDQDVNCWYSTDDGGAWTLEYWLSNSYENYLGDVWVDLNSTAFYGALRQDVSASVEYVRYKEGDITDPSSWGGSVAINDDASLNLSSAYGPSVNYNELGEAIIAWTSYEGSVYSIWFDTYSGVAVEEKPGDESAVGFINLAPNPSNGIAKLSYVVKTEGNVNISVFDAAGRTVSTLVNETKPAGDYTFTLKNQNLAAGIYFVRVQTPEGVNTKSMTIIR